ncbi:DNA phosphorothioation-associated protein 4 [candidate division KSB1 bacterium]|nr:DNA phosphorothioation-associated protein 4 [candidate division KSB1 bacterium]
MPRRIYYEKKTEIYDLLMESEEQIFSTRKDILLLAASIGYNKGKEKILSTATGEGEIHWEVFERNATDVAIINAIALSKTNDLNVLLDTEESFDTKITILEKYANGGIQILKEKLLDQPGEPIDNLINYIFNQVKEKKEEGILEKIDHEI